MTKDFWLGLVAGALFALVLLSIGVNDMQRRLEQAELDQALCGHLVEQRDEYIEFLKAERNTELRAVGRALLPAPLVAMLEEKDNGYGSDSD